MLVIIILLLLLILVDLVRLHRKIDKLTQLLKPDLPATNEEIEKLLTSEDHSL
jgi:hypothetical protein